MLFNTIVRLFQKDITTGQRRLVRCAIATKEQAKVMSDLWVAQDVTEDHFGVSNFAVTSQLGGA